MFSGIQHVIWDWNGTLLDDVEAALCSINTMLEERGMPVLARERYRRIFGFPVIDCYRALGFEFSTDEEWDAIAKEFHAHYDRNSVSADLTRGVRKVLSGLNDEGVSMSVLSASETGKLKLGLKTHNIERYFSNVAGHNDLYGSSKIELGRSLISRIDVPADKVLLIGDTTHDYEVAEALGCRCRLYLGGHQDRSRLQACGCDTFESFEGILAGR